MQKIQTVCVIGSGVMGSGIAAQVANSKTKVILLDITDGIVQDSYNKLLTSKPPALSHPHYAKYIQLGNLKDNLALVKKADLIFEVIIEKLEIKHQLYEKISPYLKSKAVLASNTSTLQLAALTEKLPDNIKSRFIITHFFNPPRYMELVELITSSHTDKTIIPLIADFLQIKLGKTIVECNDTPGFIANRVGCFLLEMVVREGIKEGLNPQTIDEIFCRDLGFPSTAIFGLYDLIGHDVMHLISKSLLNSLPVDDKYHEVCTKLHVLDKMRSEGLIGRKAGAGFYKLVKDKNGKTVKQVINFENFSYRDSSENKLNPLAKDEAAQKKFISKMLEQFFSYAGSLIPSVTSKAEDIDKAMKLGYSLKYGPFELEERGKKGDFKSSFKEPTSLLLSNDTPILLANDSAQLLRINNHHIFTMKTKMNILNTEVFTLLIQAVGYLEQQNKPIYIFPDGNNFSAGADLKYLNETIERKDFKSIADYLALGQKAMLCLKYAKVPVIACARGVALGGGAEILLHAHQVVAHQNLNAGLVELGVGLIPAFGGTKEMFLRAKGDKERLINNLRNILSRNKSSSADYFSADYNIMCLVVMHKDLLLEEATTHHKSFIRKEVKEREVIKLPPVDLMREIDTSTFNSLQLDILNFFQKIIDKKAISEEQLLDLEREKFLQLLSRPFALEKIRSLIY